MLAIKFESGNVRYWQVGEPNNVNTAETYAIREILVDGLELEYIRSMFGQSNDSPYFLIPKGNVVRLFGDLAKTVVGNLNY